MQIHIPSQLHEYAPGLHKTLARLCIVICMVIRCLTNEELEASTNKCEDAISFKSNEWMNLNARITSPHPAHAPAHSLKIPSKNPLRENLRGSGGFFGGKLWKFTPNNKWYDGGMEKTAPKKKYNVIDWRIRFWSKVDKSGDCWLWMGAKHEQGYGMFKLHDKSVGAHRVSYELEYGSVPEGRVIDHRCHTEACVRPSHLRAVTQKQNTENKGGLASTNTSGHRGVSWNSQYGKWKVSVRHNGKLHYFGLYTDLQEAAEVARVKRNELFTHNDKDRESQFSGI